MNYKYYVKKTSKTSLTQLHMSRIKSPDVQALEKLQGVIVEEFAAAAKQEEALQDDA